MPKTSSPWSDQQLDEIRKEFPLLRRRVNRKPLVYLDNAATAQKPRSVIRSVSQFYMRTNANVHRGVYKVSQEATALYEGVRPLVMDWLGTRDEGEIIFTSGTTDSLNLVMQCWGKANVLPGDVVAVTRMEHHANFVPWQVLAKESGAAFKIVELDSEYRINQESLNEVLSLKPKVLALTMMSNVLGTINPVSEIAHAAKAAGVGLVVVDAAQSVAHVPFRIQDLGPVDFVAFSAHKICGPAGVGILWGRRRLLEQMKPYRYGGDMIAHVGDEDTIFNELPFKFEAGTPNAEGVVGFGAALRFLNGLGRESMQRHEDALLGYALQKFSSFPEVQIVGPLSLRDRGAVLSFVIDGVHPHDVATFFDYEGVAIRAGHHCAHPLLNHLGFPATNRASFSFYNTFQEVDALVDVVQKTLTYFKSKAGRQLGFGTSRRRAGTAGTSASSGGHRE